MGRSQRVRDDRGQAVPWVVLATLLAGMAMLALARLGSEAVGSARAQTAADAASLAAAAGDDDGAESLARRNGSELAVVRRSGAVGRRSEVAVVVDGRGGAASATAVGLWPPPPLTGTAALLAPAMQAAVHRAQQLLGEPIPIVSGYRSRAQQQRLWDARATNPYPVAAPGTSRHERGLAIDVGRGFVERLAAVGPAAGLCRPLPLIDPVHFELCPTP
jgi:hypothetical protein